MKKFTVFWKDGSKNEVWASNAHNAKEIAIGNAAFYGKLQDYWREQILKVELS